MSAADTTLLTRQREMLLQKLDEFERTNKALRRLLREQQATEVCTKFFFLLLQNSLPCNVNTREHLKHLVSDTTSVLVSIPGAKVAFKLKFVGTIRLILKKKKFNADQKFTLFDFQLLFVLWCLRKLVNRYC